MSSWLLRRATSKRAPRSTGKAGPSVGGRLHDRRQHASRQNPRSPTVTDLRDPYPVSDVSGPDRLGVCVVVACIDETEHEVAEDHANEAIVDVVQSDEL